MSIRSTYTPLQCVGVSYCPVQIGNMAISEVLLIHLQFPSVTLIGRGTAPGVSVGNTSVSTEVESLVAPAHELSHLSLWVAPELSVVLSHVVRAVALAVHGLSTL